MILSFLFIPFTLLSNVNDSCTCELKKQIKVNRKLVKININKIKINKVLVEADKNLKGDSLPCSIKLFKLKNVNDSIIFNIKNSDLRNQFELDSLRTEFVKNQNKSAKDIYVKNYYKYFQNKHSFNNMLKKYKINPDLVSYNNAISHYKEILNSASAFNELPSYYQTRKRVSQTLPSNSQSLNQTEIKQLHEKLENLQQSFCFLKDSLKNDTNINFKINPIRKLPFSERIKFNSAFFPKRSIHYVNSIDFEILLGIKVLLTKKSNIILNMGPDIALSERNYSPIFRPQSLIYSATLQSTINKVFLFNLTSEYWKSINTSESQSNKDFYKLILGISTNFIVKTQIGINLLDLKNKNNQLLNLRFSL